MNGVASISFFVFRCVCGIIYLETEQEIPSCIFSIALILIPPVVVTPPRSQVTGRASLGRPTGLGIGGIGWGIIDTAGQLRLFIFKIKV